MPEFVMHHPKLPGQPITVFANDESELSSGRSEQERAGWQLVKTEREKVRDGAGTEPAEPVKPETRR